jgi:hypothetical protein
MSANHRPVGVEESRVATVNGKMKVAAHTEKHLPLDSDSVSIEAYRRRNETKVYFNFSDTCRKYNHSFISKISL